MLIHQFAVDMRIHPMDIVFFSADIFIISSYDDDKWAWLIWVECMIFQLSWYDGMWIIGRYVIAFLFCVIMFDITVCGQIM